MAAGTSLITALWLAPSGEARTMARRGRMLGRVAPAPAEADQEVGTGLVSGAVWAVVAPLDHPPSP